MLSHHHSTTMPTTTLQPRTPPGPPFQDLLKRTRAPGAHPLAWPATTSFAALAILSLGMPALAHHDRYRDHPNAYLRSSHPLYNEKIPKCTAKMLDKHRMYVAPRGEVPTGGYSWTKGEYTYYKYQTHSFDQDGWFHTRSCHVESTENRPPVVKQSIRDRALAPDTSKVHVVPLSAIFEDPDGDPLTYTVTSSDTDMVTVAVRNDGTLAMIVVAKVRDRRVTVTVTASDGKGGTASTSYTVLVTGEVVDSGDSGDSGDSPDTTNPDDGSSPPEPEVESPLEEIAKELGIALAEEITQEVAEKVVQKIIEKLRDKGRKKIGKAIVKRVAIAMVAGPQFAPFIGLGLTISDLYDLFSDAGIVSSEEEFNRLAEAIYIHQEALENGTITLAQALSGQNFTVPLSLGQSAAKDEDPCCSDNTPGFNALFSGNVQFSRFDDSSGDFEFDGSTTAYSFGLDVFPRPGVPLVTGLQLAFTSSNADYEDKELDIKGAYELRMVTVHPTIAWDASDNLTLWASLGYGRGETELTIKSIADDIFNRVEGRSSTDNDAFFSFAGGANVKVWQSDASALTIKVDGSTASFMDDSVQQGRIAAQFSRDITLNGGRLRPSADLALLFSSSDATAAELTGGLSWLPDESRLSGSTSARVLLFGDDRSEWGIGGSLSLLAGPRGEGLSVALQPSFGQSGSTGTGLNPDAWDLTTPADLARSTAPLTGQLHAELGYGFRTPNALLTPYTQLNMAHSSTTATAGLRYQLDSSLDLDFSASHRSRSSGNNDSRVFLQLRSDL